MFICPIFLMASQTPFSNNPKIFSKIIFSLLYNLALAHQLIGANQGPESRDNCRKAVVLYKSAYNLNTVLTPMEELLLVNNLGGCHSVLGNLDEARSCFEDILNTNVALISQGACVPDDYMDVFTWNLLSFLLTPSAMAPAA